jgi:RNA polymerase sigma factor (sigma-70 family)
MSEDNFIIIEVLSGKKEQYSILMDRYHNELFKYIYNITNDYNATEDLLQEVFIKIYKNLSKFDSDKASFRTWIYRISSNHVMNYFNSKEYKNRQHNITLETVSSSDDVEGDYIKDQKIK